VRKHTPTRHVRAVHEVVDCIPPSDNDCDTSDEEIVSTASSFLLRDLHDAVDTFVHLKKGDSPSDKEALHTAFSNTDTPTLTMTDVAKYD